MLLVQRIQSIRCTHDLASFKAIANQQLKLLQRENRRVNDKYIDLQEF